MSVKINSLEIENVKRIKAVKLEPSANGLTIIGGNNNQGKTSVLDAIAWALGGDKYKPTAAARDGAYTDPILHVELSNGLIVERKGKNSSLKVIDPHGNKAGQQLLNSFLSALALDLPKFMHASDKEKAAILLQIIGIGDQLAQLEAEESRLYNQRTAIGRIADQKQICFRVAMLGECTQYACFCLRTPCKTASDTGTKWRKPAKARKCRSICTGTHCCTGSL